MRVVRPLRRLLGLPVSEVRDLLGAQALLLAARHALRRRPPGQLLRPVPATRTPTPVSSSAGNRLERMAMAVDRVSRFGLIRPTCLERAIALDWVAQRMPGGAAAVRIGVRRQSDMLLAHAWIEYDGHAIGDESVDVRHFVPFHDFSALLQ